MEYASKGVAGAGLGLGIAGTALGVLGNGLMGNGVLGNGLLGGWRGNGFYNGYGGMNVGCYDMPVNRYEAQKDARIAELDTEVKLRDANTFTMGEMNNLRDYVDRKFDRVEHELCDQKVYNATNTATIGCLSNQVNGLQAVLSRITRVVVPNGAICPGWGDVTVSITPAAAADAAAGA